MNNDDFNRVIRGGCWFSDESWWPLPRGQGYARVAYRDRDIPSDRGDYLGFRLSRLVNPLEQLSEVINEKE